MVVMTKHYRFGNIKTRQAHLRMSKTIVFVHVFLLFLLFAANHSLSSVVLLLVAALTYIHIFAPMQAWC